MLESMTTSRLPTRAEATDVANAILDGTDCIMLSGESAMGNYPEEAVAMLAKIATSAEAHREAARRTGSLPAHHPAAPTNAHEAISDVVQHSIGTVPCSAVFVPTHTGTTARMISRFKPHVWIVAVSPDVAVCQGLAFSYGVQAIDADDEPTDWRDFAGNWFCDNDMPARLAILVAGPSTQNPAANYRVEFLRFAQASSI
jgi:pyruvate kinase